MIITVTMFDLAADFATRPSGAMHVHIQCAGAKSCQELVKLSSVESLIPGCLRCRNIRTDIGRRDCSRDGCRGCRTWLGSSRAVTQVRAEKNSDTTVNSSLAQVDMSLLNGPLQIRILQRVSDFVRGRVDPGVELAITSG